MRDRNHKYAINLTLEERARLNRLTMQGKIQVRKLKRAKILLLADAKHSQGNKNDKEIAEKVDVSPATVERVRRAYVAGGVDGALVEKPRSGRPPTIQGKERAKITALACSTAPTGHARWTLRLLAEKVVDLEILERISHTTVRDILKKTS